MIRRQEDIDFYSAKLKTENVASVVTEINFAVGDLFKQFVQENFSHLDYFIIDEEIVAELKDPIGKLNTAEYTFVIDPIDGTLTYATGLPYYAVSVGVFKEGKPYLGFLYAPALEQMVYCDETDAYVVDKPFTSNEKKTKITDLNDINVAPVFFEHPTGMSLTAEWNKDRKAFPMNMYSAVVHFMYVAMGKGMGYYYCVYLWDIAGGLAIFDKVGVKVLNAKTGEEFKPSDIATFDKKLRSREIYIACLPKHFEYLQKIAKINFVDAM